MTCDPYVALVALAERERDLIDDGRVEELAELAAARAAHVARLPAQAPASARPALERAHALQLATAAKLRASLAEARHNLAALDRGRGVATAYGSVAGSAVTVGAARVDHAA
jgi:hypothetical protein